jgi:hypothetical protein
MTTLMLRDFFSKNDFKKFEMSSSDICKEMAMFVGR